MLTPAKKKKKKKKKHEYYEILLQFKITDLYLNVLTFYVKYDLCAGKADFFQAVITPAFTANIQGYLDFVLKQHFLLSIMKAVVMLNIFLWKQ